MFRTCTFLASILLLCGFAAPNKLPNPECAAIAATRNSFEFSLRSTRNESGDWISRMEGRRDMDNRTDNVAMHFNHRVVECGGKQIFHFEGLFAERNVDSLANRLFFHPKCGTNVAITNMGRTIQKLNGEERFHGVAYTNRPLQPNELFQVVVDKRTGGKFGYFMAIGVTTTTPYDGEIQHHINALKPATWVMYHNDVYHNGNRILRNRPLHLDQLKVGDRVGIKKTDSGTLLLVVNGKEDAVASNVPNNVYGVFECYGDPSQVTITS